MRLFRDSWKRIDRAVVHAKGLGEGWAKLLGQGAYEVVPRDNKDGTWTFEAVFSEPLENDLALELGEFFYQLRSALDSAMWQAATILNGGQELPADENRLEFPICIDKDKFKKAALHKWNFPQKFKEWLESIQSYSAEKPIGDPDRALEVTLQTIHDCARHDRHRRLHIVAAVPTEILYDIKFSEPSARVTFEEPIRANFFEGKCKFLRIGVEADRPIEKAILATALKVEISVDEIPIYEGSSDLADEFRRFLLATEYVIRRFENTFR